MQDIWVHNPVLNKKMPLADSMPGLHVASAVDRIALESVKAESESWLETVKIAYKLGQTSPIHQLVVGLSILKFNFFSRRLYNSVEICQLTRIPRVPIPDLEATLAVDSVICQGNTGMSYNCIMKADPTPRRAPGPRGRGGSCQWFSSTNSTTSTWVRWCPTSQEDSSMDISMYLLYWTDTKGKN